MTGSPDPKDPPQPADVHGGAPTSDITNTDATDITDSAELADTDSADLTDTGFADSTDLADPTDITDFYNSADTGSANSADPADLADPANSANSTDSADLANPANSTDPADLADFADSTGLAHITDSADSAVFADLADVAAKTHRTTGDEPEVNQADTTGADHGAQTTHATDAAGTRPADHSSPWPVANLSRVQRMRVLAAGVRAPYAEGHINAPFEVVWSALADLESSIPLMVTDVRDFHFLDTPGPSMPDTHVTTDARDSAATGDGPIASPLIATARGLFGQRARFQIVLDEGWCVMRSRFIVGGFAAEPDGEGTRFAACGGLRGAGAPLAALVVGNRGARRMVRRMRSAASNG